MSPYYGGNCSIASVYQLGINAATYIAIMLCFLVKEITHQHVHMLIFALPDLTISVHSSIFVLCKFLVTLRYLPGAVTCVGTPSHHYHHMICTLSTDCFPGTHVNTIKLDNILTIIIMIMSLSGHMMC